MRGDDAEIVVFDTTTQPVRVTVQGHHLVIGAPRPTGLRDIVEVYELSNDTVVTAVGRDSTTAVWSAPLPAGATNFTAGQGDVAASSIQTPRWQGDAPPALRAGRQADQLHLRAGLAPFPLEAHARSTERAARGVARGARCAGALSLAALAGQRDHAGTHLQALPRAECAGRRACPHRCAVHGVRGAFHTRRGRRCRRRAGDGRRAVDRLSSRRANTRAHATRAARRERRRTRSPPSRRSMRGAKRTIPRSPARTTMRNALHSRRDSPPRLPTEPWADSFTGQFDANGDTEAGAMPARPRHCNGQHYALPPSH